MNAPSQSTALVALEHQLQPLAPHFKAALAGMMPVERLIRTVLVSVERLPELLNCDRQSIIMSAMSAACLGLEVDGVTGQAYLIPFKKKAQLVIGYKGFNTIAARSGVTITGAIVREGDAFEFDLGESVVRHRPNLERPQERRIIAAWAKAAHRDRPAILSVLGIDEIMAVRGKSPGAKRSDSPWNDPIIGFPAMAEKTAKRRLARSLPMSTLQLAARLDSAVTEDDKPAWITPERGLEIEGQAAPATPYEDSPTPSAGQLIGPGEGDLDTYAAIVDERLSFPGESAEDLAVWWNSAEQRDMRRRFGDSDQMRGLIARTRATIEQRRRAA